MNPDYLFLKTVGRTYTVYMLNRALVILPEEKQYIKPQSKPLKKTSTL